MNFPTEQKMFHKRLCLIFCSISSNYIDLSIIEYFFKIYVFGSMYKNKTDFFPAHSLEGKPPTAK